MIELAEWGERDFQWTDQNWVQTSQHPAEPKKTS